MAIAISSWTDYEPSASQLFEAGYIMAERLIPERLATWSKPNVPVMVYAAFDDRDHVWKFRAKHIREKKVSPVFTEANVLLIWMQVEGWDE